MDLGTLLINSLTGIQQTIEIAKALRGVDARLNDAEYKARIADLIDGLLSAREALSDAKMSIQDMKETIRLLETKLADRGRFRDSNGMLFQLDEDGNEVGQPYCNHCCVKEEKLFRLLNQSSNSPFRYYCRNCKGRYDENPNYRPAQKDTAGRNFLSGRIRDSFE